MVCWGEMRIYTLMGVRNLEKKCKYSSNSLIWKQDYNMQGHLHFL